MRKAITIILALAMTMSLAACGGNNTNSTNNTNNTAVESNVNNASGAGSNEEKTYESFGSMLKSIAEAEYYFENASGSLKVYDKEQLASYEEKAAVITEKALEDNGINIDSAKLYKYYKNDNGNKSEKDYVVVYDENNEVLNVYEVILSVDTETNEPSFKEFNENTDIVNDQFKTLFKAELEAATE